ncbi:MAG: phosphomethylpyrimidine synthase ThiC, partial [Butyrivibrio sp.]|nr:phosphomethylpyrimidine synthase ThiC [Butyrivibrio sp.]
MNLETANKRPYSTQMEAARKGIVTPEMEVVAKKENRDIDFIRQMVAEGKVVIPANPAHKGLDPNGVGS